MADYRDPKVTTRGTERRRGMGSWIGIAIAAIIVVLLIAWWWGGFGGADQVAVEQPVVVEPAPVEGEAPVTTEPAAPAAPVQQ